MKKNKNLILILVLSMLMLSFNIQAIDCQNEEDVKEEIDIEDQSFSLFDFGWGVYTGGTEIDLEANDGSTYKVSHALLSKQDVYQLSHTEKSNVGLVKFQVLSYFGPEAKRGYYKIKTSDQNGKEQDLNFNTDVCRDEPGKCNTESGKYYINLINGKTGVDLGEDWHLSFSGKYNEKVEVHSHFIVKGLYRQKELISDSPFDFSGIDEEQLIKFFKKSFKSNDYFNEAFHCVKMEGE